MIKSILALPILACLTCCQTTEQCNLDRENWLNHEPKASSLQATTTITFGDSSIKVNGEAVSESEFNGLLEMASDDSPLYIWVIDARSGDDCHKVAETMTKLSDAGVCRGDNCFLQD